MDKQCDKCGRLLVPWIAPYQYDKYRELCSPCYYGLKADDRDKQEPPDDTK